MIDLIDSSVDAVFVKDLRGRYVKINATGARILGRPVSDAIGRDDLEMLPPEAARKAVDGDRAVLASGQTHSYQVSVEVEGVVRHYQVTKGPCGDGDRGAIWGVALEVK